MERLTNRIKQLGKDDLIVYTKGKYEDTVPGEMSHDDIRAVLKKLAYYEDAEEQAEQALKNMESDGIVMSERKLLPCPYCGGEVKLDEDEFYMFCCDKCGAGITFAKELEDGTATDCDKDESIDKWNTRKPIEKVVEHLGKKVLESTECKAEADIEMCGSSSSRYCGEIYAYNKAIEIVKQGGASDDVCEWKSTSNGEFIQNPHTSRLFSNEPSMKNVHCNTCGKKIKVVD